jgi:hypothetical protein
MRTALKELVNRILRRGIALLANQPVRTTGFDLGASLIGCLDNVKETLTRVEGEDHK